MTDQFRRAAMAAIDTANNISARKSPALTDTVVTAWAEVFADAAPWITAELAVPAVRAHYGGNSVYAVEVGDVIANAKAIRDKDQKSRMQPFRCRRCQDTGTVCNDDGVPARGRPRCAHPFVRLGHEAVDKGMA